MTTIDKATIFEAYEEVRNDNTETRWLILSYESKTIILHSKGSDYEEFKRKFTDGVRLYGFVRFNTGDELSKRTKFVLISWIGSQVGALNKAKMSTDKPIVKSVIQNVAVEIQANDLDQLEENYLIDELRKAGGANYGTGSRLE